MTNKINVLKILLCSAAISAIGSTASAENFRVADAGDACPKSIWSGAKKAPSGWRETQEKVDSPTLRTSGSRTECHYDNGNKTVYIWRDDLNPDKARCPRDLWTGAKRAPSGWRETQTKVVGPNKRVGANNRVECHYPKPKTVYIWK